jgi:acyl-coenzyme A thioesterase PaaI-like protein
VNLDETPEELAARAELADELQRLGHALVAHRVDLPVARELTAFARQFHELVSQGETRNRSAEVLRSPRVKQALGGKGAIIQDGEEIDLFRDSFVSGRTNPMGIGVNVVRRGDAAVASTILGAAFEGAPGRAHGGVVGAILDEAMGYVLPIIGEMAYTANLTIDYIAPAPLGAEIVVTARLRDRAGRKLWIEAIGETEAAGVFVRAEALFLTVDLTRFANSDGDAVNAPPS